MSYRPELPPALIIVHRLQYVGDTLALVLYGIATAISILCVTSLLQTFRNRSSRRQLYYVCMVYICGTLFIAGESWANAFSTIDYPLYPGGPFTWQMEHYNHPVIVMGNVAFTMTAWLADGFMIYRCYIVYTLEERWRCYILLGPILLYLASLATGILLLVQSAIPQSSLFSQVNIGLAYFTIAAALNVVITGLISTKLITHRIRMQKILGGEPNAFGVYTSLTTILVESSALYAGFFLMFVIPFAVDHPAAKLFLPMLAQVQVIAPLLVAYRLTKKRAWTPDTGRTLSSMTGVAFAQDVGA
ncbi:hypothetical protein D9611_013153 [Ephemerocybe angulata]|uniref:Uncharacterized protein n=1 Tax=Ephemerocybe angulata TaxID=980116 RepID=A0A8H5BXT8_9AGAR|nr:hypothetical protein D9611_013153 [Tulosesus angulatus]